MPTGHYRFRRSLGNVGSRFRGARPDTYPLYTGVLDSYPGAAAAYSLRALSRGWLAGDVVEVRSSAGGDPASFTASQVANGTLEAWVGVGNDGFVSTWYDQSGNANDATQIATASQPKIVDAGALVTGGLDFDGVDDHLEADGFAFSPSGDFNVFTVANFSLNNYWDTRDGGGDGLFLQRGGSDFKSNYNGTSSEISVVTGDVLLSSELDGTDNNLYLNGGSKATTTVVAGLSTTANFLIGINFAGAEGIGTMRELILYDTSQSANRAAIDAEIIANYGL